MSKDKKSKEEVKALTLTQQRVLDIYADPSYKTITDVAKAAGVSRQTVYSVIRKPEAKPYKLKREKKVVSLQKTTISDLSKTAEVLSLKAAALLDTEALTDQDIGQAIILHKTLLDTAKTVKEHGLDDGATQQVDQEDLEAFAEDLKVIFELGYKSNGDKEICSRLVEAYLASGEVPDEEELLDEINQDDTHTTGNGAEVTDNKGLTPHYLQAEDIENPEVIDVGFEPVEEQEQ